MKNLHTLRTNLGITQEQLAAILNVKQCSVANWEAGKRYPTADKLPALANALGCTIDDLYTAKAG